jgi:hypothetical protein
VGEDGRRNEIDADLRLKGEKAEREREKER